MDGADERLPDAPTHRPSNRTAPPEPEHRHSQTKVAPATAKDSKLL